MVLSKLRTKWRNHPDFSLPTRDASSPMDTQEQEELVRSFEKSHAEHSRFWRRVFAAFLFVQSAFLVYSISQQALAPWELRFHAYFMDEVDSWMIIFTDWVSVLACSMGIMGLLCKSEDNRRQWLWYSCYISIIPTGFWLYYMLSLNWRAAGGIVGLVLIIFLPVVLCGRKPELQWDMLWLPFGPCGGAGISLYVDHLLAESAEEIRKLRDYMYSYKAS